MAHCFVCRKEFSSIIYEVRTMKFWHVFCSAECDHAYFKALPGSAEYVPEKHEEINDRFEILDL